MAEDVKNPPDGMPRITAGVYYQDSAAAIEWLEKAFGFKTRLKIPGPEGQILHSELEIGDGLIFVGHACPDEKKTSPQDLDGAMTAGMYIYVDDVDGHCENARAAGATIIQEPEDMFYGDRVYTASDPEGHHWKFGTHVRDVPLEEMPFPVVEE
jgi:uncharacterized glyoxalase superfamily protein PhnB